MVICLFNINLIYLKCQSTKSINKHITKMCVTLIFVCISNHFLLIFFEGKGIELDKVILKSIWKTEQIRISFLKCLKRRMRNLLFKIWYFKYFSFFFICLLIWWWGSLIIGYKNWKILKNFWPKINILFSLVGPKLINRFLPEAVSERPWYQSDIFFNKVHLFSTQDNRKKPSDINSPRTVSKAQVKVDTLTTLGALKFPGCDLVPLSLPSEVTDS